MRCEKGQACARRETERQGDRETESCGKRGRTEQADDAAVPLRDPVARRGRGEQRLLHHGGGACGWSEAAARIDLQ